MTELSVIIPTYNRAALLRNCLQALSNQTQRVSDWQVIVAVDGSMDGTREMLDELSVPFHMEVIWQENRGQASALNAGWQSAATPYVLFIDDDIIASPGLVAEHLRVQRETQGVAGLGYMTIGLPPGAGGLAQYLARWSRRHHDGLRAGVRSPFFMDCFSGNFSIPRSALAAAGGFAGDLARSFDIELGYRLHRNGAHFVYIPGAEGRQLYTKEFADIARDAEKAGIANVEMLARHPGILPYLELGRYREARQRALMMRHLLLTLSVPDNALDAFGRALRRTPWAAQWYPFVYSYFFWRGVRQRLGDDPSWKRLTTSAPVIQYQA